MARDPHEGCGGREVVAARGHGAAVGSGPQDGDKGGAEVLGSAADIEGRGNGDTDRGGKGRAWSRRRTKAQLRRGQGNVDDRARRGRGMSKWYKFNLSPLFQR